MQSRKIDIIRTSTAPPEQWTTITMVATVFFGLGVVLPFKGRDASLDFFTGFMIEKILSVDNLFVFVMIFDAFKTPEKYQRKVLTIGIASAVVLRGLMIAVGVQLVQRFRPVLLVFAGILVLSSLKVSAQTSRSTLRLVPLRLLLCLPASCLEAADLRGFTLQGWRLDTCSSFPRRASRLSFLRTACRWRARVCTTARPPSLRAEQRVGLNRRTASSRSPRAWLGPRPDTTATSSSPCATACGERRHTQPALPSWRGRADLLSTRAHSELTPSGSLVCRPPACCCSKATPLMLVLICIELCDVMFAVDSIPAIVGITQDTFIVFTSNIFAILGLRNLYVLLARAVKDLVYLKLSVAVILGFVGMKLLLDFAHIHISSLQSLGAVFVVLLAGIVASLAEQKRVAATKLAMRKKRRFLPSLARRSS